VTLRSFFARVAVSIVAASTIVALGAGAAAAADETPAPIPVPTTPASTTHHSVSIGGTTLRYAATAERLVLVDKLDKPAVAMFAVSYELAGVPHARRPVAFLWNGGPGSSSLWLHMGSFAPLRVATNGTGAIVPPSHLVPNDGSLLATTDLVFIDAPGTGFSRLVGTAKKDEFYGIDQDARAS
jgi:carboxypeptidase C (cathepsin A)